MSYLFSVFYLGSLLSLIGRTSTIDGVCFTESVLWIGVKRFPLELFYHLTYYGAVYVTVILPLEERYLVSSSFKDCRLFFRTTHLFQLVNCLTPVNLIFGFNLSYMLSPQL